MHRMRVCSIAVGVAFDVWAGDAVCEEEVEVILVDVFVAIEPRPLAVGVGLDFTFAAEAALELAVIFLVDITVVVADWPMYRNDASRSGYTAEPLPSSMKLRWVYRAKHGCVARQVMQRSRPGTPAI